MGTMSVRLLESLYEKARGLAKREGVSINQFGDDGPGGKAVRPSHGGVPGGAYTGGCTPRQPEEVRAGPFEGSGS